MMTSIEGKFIMHEVYTPTDEIYNGNNVCTVNRISIITSLLFWTVKCFCMLIDRLKTAGGYVNM